MVQLEDNFRKSSTVKPEISGDFSMLMSWADNIRKPKVRTNSELLGYENSQRFWC